MEKKETWVVALDLTPMDRSILNYVAGLASMLHPDKIQFIYVNKKDCEHTAVNESLDYDRVLIEDARLKLIAKVNRINWPETIERETQMLVGDPFEEISTWIRKNDAQLVIVGIKEISSGSGLISKRLSKSLHANFLLVPVGAEAKLDDVLVSSDFSAYSALGMKAALRMRRSNPDMKIHLFTGFEVPNGYTKTGKSYDEMSQIMQENAQKRADRWMEELSTAPYEVLPVNIEERAVTDQLLDVAQHKAVDMIIIGSRGHTEGSQLILGSNTWDLIKINQEIPLLIVKKKGESLALSEIVNSI